MEEYTFIVESNELMKGSSNGNTRCLLVLGEGFDDGILVDSGGFDYARYSALIPNARQIIAYDQRYESIEVLESGINETVDDVLELVRNYNGDGKLCVDLCDIAEEHSLNQRDFLLLEDTLFECDEIKSAHLNGNVMIIEINRQEEEQATSSRYCPSEEEIEIIKAKHILWNHDQQGGERADFSNMYLTDCILTNASLNCANFKNAILNGGNLCRGSFMSCDFTGAELYNIDGIEAVFEESDFTGAKLVNCNFLDADLMECNFTGSDLSGSDFNMARIDNSDFTGANTETAKLVGAQTDNCIGLQVAPSEEEQPKMDM